MACNPSCYGLQPFVLWPATPRAGACNPNVCAACNPVHPPYRATSLQSQVLEEYRAALGLYHRTVRGFQQLRFEVAQCCAQEFSLVVELQL